MLHDFWQLLLVLQFGPVVHLSLRVHHQLHVRRLVVRGHPERRLHIFVNKNQIEKNLELVLERFLKIRNHESQFILQIVK